MGGRLLNRRTGLAALIVVLAIPIGAAAWACVPQPLVQLSPRSSGQVGAKGTISAVRLSGGAIEVRWNALDGPLLATGSGTDLQADFTVPPASDGLYTLITLVRATDGAVASSVSVPFEVVGGALPVVSKGSSKSESSPSAIWALLVAGVALVVSVLAITLSRRPRRTV